MKIHLSKFPAHGLHLEGEEESDILQLEDPLYRATGPVRYDLEIGLSGGGLFATGSLEVEMEMECVRCLNFFPYTLRVPDFAAQIECDTAEMIDLTPAMREEILLALPAHPHCDGEGSRVCPRPSLPVKAQEIPFPEGAENPWKKLDQLQKPEETV